MSSTKERLASALAEALAPAWMIEAARAGKYDDYESPSATPLQDLNHDLIDQGMHDLARRVRGGEFDGTKEEADAWAESPEGKAAIQELFASTFGKLGGDS